MLKVFTTFVGILAVLSGKLEILNLFEVLKLSLW